MTKNRLPYLFERYMNGTSTEREDIELSTYILAPEHAATLEQLKEQFWEKANAEAMEDEEAEKFLTKILHPIPQKARIFSLRRVAVAASIIFAVGIGSYFAFFNKPAKQDEIVKTPELPNDVKAPETNRAMISLANGQKVYVDSAPNGSLAVQEGVRIEKLADGRIIYTGSSTDLVYNTLTNPRGSKAIDMTLADGSKVWLNAGSSVTYPIAFISNERKVTITGEAYFEVAHNSAMPFTLKKGNMEVMVLGTKFNVNAYDDEADIKVTLLEGSVKVSNGPATGMLKPGQQAQVASDVKIVSNINLEEVMAWKNDKFQFGAKTDIGTIMRQISRWYDVDVVYDGAVPKQRFGGEMPRNSNLSQVLEILKTSGVKFTIEGRKVTIRP